MKPRKFVLATEDHRCCICGRRIPKGYVYFRRDPAPPFTDPPEYGAY